MTTHSDNLFQVNWAMVALTLVMGLGVGLFVVKEYTWHWGYRTPWKLAQKIYPIVNNTDYQGFYHHATLTENTINGRKNKFLFTDVFYQKKNSYLNVALKKMNLERGIGALKITLVTFTLDDKKYSIHPAAPTLPFVSNDLVFAYFPLARPIMAEILNSQNAEITIETNQGYLKDTIMNSCETYDYEHHHYNYKHDHSKITDPNDRHIIKAHLNKMSKSRSRKWFSNNHYNLCNKIRKAYYR